jgi:hypothetical protein
VERTYPSAESQHQDHFGQVGRSGFQKEPRLAGRPCVRSCLLACLLSLVIDESIVRTNMSALCCWESSILFGDDDLHDVMNRKTRKRSRAHQNNRSQWRNWSRLEHSSLSTAIVV